MADNSSMSYKTGEAAGHAQIKKDEMMEKARGAVDFAKQTAQESTEKASGFIQQAADAVKNAVGMDNNNSSSTATKH